MSDSQAISAAVASLYNTYPFPPEPLLDQPPPGYNWRWNWLAAANFCTGQKPRNLNPRILDVGCGTGVGTEYLAHLNPQASIVGIDLSTGALDMARARCQKSGATGVEFRHLSLFDLAELPGEFDLINCVGVLHHTPDPISGIQAVAKKLAPGGLLHIFVYGELGRWEIKLMQEAISLLQAEKRGDFKDGVAVGRQLFAALPPENPLRKRDQERWGLDNHQDAYFADMYVHPQEIDYSIPTLFELIDASGLEFLGFSNPQVWNLARLIADAPALIERAKTLGDRQRYRLIELLDPQAITHYEFFLGRSPISKPDWSSDVTLMSAIPEPSPCIYGWRDSRQIFDYDYRVINLTEPEWQFLLACDRHQNQQQSVQQILESLNACLDDVRSLQRQQVILLSPAH
jgi:SAM-dependent methyltransferase